MRTTIKIVLAGALLASAACKNKAEEATEAQETANEKAVEAAEAQHEANAKAAEAERVRTQELAKDRAEAREDLQESIEAADRKTEHLRDKFMSAKGAMRKNAEAASNEVALRRAKLDANIVNMEAATGDAWTAAKLRVDADIAALNEAVENLDETLDD